MAEGQNGSPRAREYAILEEVHPAASPGLEGERCYIVRLESVTARNREHALRLAGQDLQPEAPIELVAIPLKQLEAIAVGMEQRQSVKVG